MDAAALPALSDNELATYLNGGYGAEKRNQAVAVVRDALRRSDNQDRAMEATYNAAATIPHLPDGPSAA